MPRAPTVLLLAHDGTNSRHILGLIAEGFAQAGSSVLRIETGPFRERLAQHPAQSSALISAFGAQLRDAITQQRVDLVLGMWMNPLMNVPHAPAPGGGVRSYFDALGVPCVLYWLDAPHWAPGGGAMAPQARPLFDGSMLFSVVNNDGIAQEMRRVLGFRNALGVPYGVAPAPDLSAHEPEFDVVFAMGPGESPPTPGMLEELRRDVPDLARLRAEQAKRVSASLRDAAGVLGDELLALQLARRDEPLLDKLESIAFSRPPLRGEVEGLLSDPERFVRVGAMVRSVDSWYRAFYFCWLDARFSCLRAGAGELPGWPTRGPCTGYVPDERQGATYARGRCGLSVMRWQDDVGVHIKPLEISSVGIPCLAHRRVGLAELLDDPREVMSFDTPEQSGAWVERLRREPELRTGIGRAARERVVREHLWQHRAASIGAWVGGVTGRW